MNQLIQSTCTLRMKEYTHRNGEMELPTEEGFYWMDDGYHLRAVEVNESAGDDSLHVYYPGGEVSEPLSWHDEARWWGPIMPPSQAH